ncbi:MAG: alpha/beta hydrolase [Leptospirales bacterium]|nr:alpha/beta hydrolase [Leptospirales bacterium]
MTANHLCFLHLARALNSAGLDILAYDLRGRGQSDKPRGVYSTQVHAADLHSLLRSKKFSKRFSRPLLVAHSLGAYAALEFLRLNPDEARGLVLLDGGARLTLGEQLRIYIMLRLSFIRLGRKFKDPEAYLSLIQNSPLVKRWSPELEAMVRYDMEVTSDGAGLNIPVHVIESELNSIGGSLNVMRSLRNLLGNRRGFEPQFASIKVPVLIVRAVQPNLFPGDSILTKRGVQEMEQEFPHVTVREIQANHYSMIMEDQPELNAMIIDFARSIKAGASKRKVVRKR